MRFNLYKTVNSIFDVGIEKSSTSLDSNTVVSLLLSDHKERRKGAQGQDYNHPDVEDKKSKKFQLKIQK